MTVDRHCALIYMWCCAPKERGAPPPSKEQGMNQIELTNRAVQLDQQFVVASRVLHEGMVVTVERLSIFLLISPFSPPPPLPMMCVVKGNRMFTLLGYR